MSGPWPSTFLDRCMFGAHTLPTQLRSLCTQMHEPSMVLKLKCSPKYDRTLASSSLLASQLHRTSHHGTLSAARHDADMGSHATVIGHGMTKCWGMIACSLHRCILEKEVGAWSGKQLRYRGACHPKICTAGTLPMRATIADQALATADRRMRMWVQTPMATIPSRLTRPALERKAASSLKFGAVAGDKVKRNAIRPGIKLKERFPTFEDGTCQMICSKRSTVPPQSCHWRQFE